MDLNKSGNLIRELRKSKKMSQKQVAKILGIEPKTVSKWETGRGYFRRERKNTFIRRFNQKR